MSDELTTPAPSFLDQLVGVNIPTDPDADQFPVIYWHNGRRGLRKNDPNVPGDFYTRASSFATALGAPWEAEERFENNGIPEAGWATQTLKLAPILWRSQPFESIKDPKTGKPIAKRWLDRYVPGATIQTEILCFMEGCTDPIVWQIKGLTGKAVTGKEGMFKQYRDGLLAAASRHAGKQLPFCSFWLPITTKRSPSGDIVYSETGYGSVITDPALQLPESLTDAMNTLFIGAERMLYGATLAAEYETWKKAKRATDASESFGAAAQPSQLPASSGRTAPTIIDAETIDEF
jgi:hypothetical protein